MAKKKENTKINVEDGLAAIVANSINSDLKKSLGEVVYTSNIDDISGWVSTGCDMLDLAIANRPNAGLPIGKIIEFTGLEGTGKSLLCAQICSQVQRQNGIAVYIDTEAAFNEEFFTALGVDTSDKWLYVKLNVLEDIFVLIENMISKVREHNSDIPVVVVIDSIMGATTKVENNDDYDKEGWATSKAIVLSKAMRKITNLISNERIMLIMTNQLRINLAATFGDKFCVDPFTTKIKIRYSV